MEHQTSAVPENDLLKNGNTENGVAVNENEDDEVSEEIHELPAEKYNETLRKIIENNLNVPLGECDLKIVPGSAKGDNYIGVVYRVTVTSKTANKKLNIIVKLPPQNQMRREQFKVRMCFVRESLFYDEVYPMYKKFQEEKGIDVAKDGFCAVPEVFASLTDEPFEGLFFEDLKASGFEMFDRLKSVTVDHVNLVMKSLAKMHAVAFAIKDQQPEWMEQFKNMTDYFTNDEEEKREQMEIYFKSLRKQAIDAVDGHEDNQLVEAANKFFDQAFAEMYDKGVDNKAAEPYAIITHGDCWNNNIMFRYDDNGVPCDIRLLDFQILRYSSPICDLSYYIFCCTTKELRKKHYRSFLDLYYATLFEFIQKLGSDPLQLFPREAFENQLKRFGCFGLTMATMVMPAFVSSGDEVPDLDAFAEKISSCEANGEVFDGSDFSFPKSKNAFNERMRGVLEDMFELGYI